MIVFVSRQCTNFAIESLECSSLVNKPSSHSSKQFAYAAPGRPYGDPKLPKLTTGTSIHTPQHVSQVTRTDPD